MAAEGRRFSDMGSLNGRNIGFPPEVLYKEQKYDSCHIVQNMKNSFSK